jgi:hypothetical protein
MEKKKEDRFEITELFMVKAGKKDRCRRFLGTIKRQVDDAGKQFVCGKVQVNDCTIYSIAENEENLGLVLDEMTLIVLDRDLHKDAGIFNEICSTKFFLN